MKYFGNGLSELHKELNTIIRKADKLEEAKTLFFELHSKLHVSSMTGAEQNETDSLLGDLMPSDFINDMVKTMCIGKWFKVLGHK